jgi:peptidoglycan-N-acetylglucosamine deacetylase
MPRRRAVIAAALTSFLAGCGGTGRPVARWAAPQTVPAPSATPSASPSRSPWVPAPLTPQASIPHPGGGNGPAGAHRITGSDAIALSFDDGPDPQYTPQLLAVLKQYDVQVTFSMIGSRIRDYPDVVRQVVAEGHNVASHSWQHLMDLGRHPWPYQNWDLRNTMAWFQTVVPDTPMPYFRAPGGNFTPGLVQLAGSLGMDSLFWDVDPEDWDAAKWGHGPAMVDHIVSVVKATTRPGSIVLSHDRVRPDTIAAYKILLPWLQDHFRIIRLP